MNKKLNYIILLVCLAFTVNVFAQDNPHVFNKYNFIKYDSNHLNFYNDTSNLSHFFNKLDTLIFNGKGKVNIMQVGGSHIQADIWSDQLRQNFQKISPNLNGGRGFLFPYRLAHTNNPYYYKVTYTGEWKGHRNSVKKHHADWGVSGITATTNDSVSTIKMIFRGDDTPYYDFKRLKVFHPTDSNYCVEIVSDTCVSILRNDSIGYTEFFFNSYQDSLEIEIHKTDSTDTPFVFQGLSLENDDPGVVYHSIGVNGASTKSYLRCNKFPSQLSVIKPDLVIFCIGINDAYDPNFCANCYKSNYDCLVSWVKAVNPDANIIFVTNNDSYYKRRYPNKRAEVVRESMKELANLNNAAMWDMYGIMGGLGSVKTWQNHKLAKKDKIHFTKQGYIVVGDLLFSAIMKEYNNHLKMEKK